MLDICLLGSGGMMPLPNRWLTAMLARYNGKLILIDCGEGTQIPFKLAGWGVRNLDAICFTHFHADHIAGLPGLLLTLGNAGRTEPLILIGPKGLEHVVKSLMVIAHNLPFPIVFETIGEESTPVVLGDFVIRSHAVEHNVLCVAYSIEIQRAGKFDVEKAKANAVPMRIWNVLQKGNTVVWEGQTFTPDAVLGPHRKGLKVCYCTDSRPVESLAAFVQGANLFICEGMYGDDASLAKAAEKKHMIFSEAAKLAKEAAVSELWLTHFSPSLSFPGEYLNYAREIFSHTLVGKDLMKKTFYFEEE